MSREITAHIINGRHGGETLRMRWSPTIKLPIKDDDQISMGEAADATVKVGDHVEYVECFRSVDGTTVLYSTSGRGKDIDYVFFKRTYPITFWPTKR